MDKYVTAFATFAGTFGTLAPAWMLYVRHARKRDMAIGVLGPERNGKSTTLSKILTGVALIGGGMGVNLAMAGPNHKYWEHRVNSISASTSDDFCRQVQEMYDSLPIFLDIGREVVGQYRCPTVTYNFDQYKAQNQ